MGRIVHCLAVLLIPLAACADPGGQEPDPVMTYSFAGAYEATGVWDLRGPFAGGEGVGGVVADLLIDKIVDASGAPSSLEGRLHDEVSDLLRAPLRNKVNAAMPARLRPDGDVMQGLAGMLATADVASDISLSDTATGVSGTETITSITMVDGGETFTVTALTLSDGVAPVSLAATLSGRVTTGATVSLDPHVFQIRYGKLVSVIAEQRLGVDLAVLTSQISSSVQCVDVVDEVTGGGDSFDIVVAGQSFSVGATMLLDACATIRTGLDDYVLGLVSKDSGIELGGLVVGTDVDGDFGIDSLRSGSNYGGEITLVPGPLAPSIGVSFSAKIR